MGNSIVREVPDLRAKEITFVLDSDRYDKFFTSFPARPDRNDKLKQFIKKAFKKEIEEKYKDGTFSVMLDVVGGYPMEVFAREGVGAGNYGVYAIVFEDRFQKTATVRFTSGKYNEKKLLQLASDLKKFLETPERLFMDKYRSILVSNVAESKKLPSDAESLIKSFAGVPSLKPPAAPAGGKYTNRREKHRKTRKHRSRKHKKTRKH